MKKPFRGVESNFTCRFAQVLERARTAFEDVGQHNQLHSGYLRVHMMPPPKKRDWMPKVWLLPRGQLPGFVFVFSSGVASYFLRKRSTPATLHHEGTRSVDKLNAARTSRLF